MAISAVGSLYASSPGGSLAVTPTAIGNILVLLCYNLNAATTTFTVSGGGVTTWHQLAFVSNASSYSAAIYYGVITSTGSSSITITDSGGSSDAFAALEFSGGAPGTWAQDGSGATNANATGATNGNYSSLTPSGSGELYVANEILSAGTIGGSTSGFTYFNPIKSGIYGEFCSFVYNASASSPTAQSPAWTQGGSDPYTGCAALIKFTLATSLPPRIKGLPAAVRRANNYFKRENGLWEPERGLIVPRVA